MSDRKIVALLLFALVAPAVMPLLPAADARSGIPSYETFSGPTDGTALGPLALAGGEPSIGIDWRTGAVLFQQRATTYRVDLESDSQSRWTDVSPPHARANIDPMLFTDAISGRTWAGGLDGSCSVMGFTDDDGASWLPAGNMCVPTLDHQTLASGPWSGGKPVHALSERALYYCAQARAVTCTTSADGGLTWGPPTPVVCVTATPGLHGSLHVGHDGLVFLPFKRCSAGAGLVVSADNGLTWSTHVVPGAFYNGHGFDPDVASTPSGWLYMAWSNGTRGASVVSLTKDNGTTWSKPVDIGAQLGVVTSTFHEVVAGDDTRAAVAFLGTTTSGDPWNEGFGGVWDLYIATTYDAGATWTTVKASSDPVQRGWICDNGTGCSGGRNLLDFMDAQLDAQGRVLVGYADGCIAACAGPSGTAAMSTSAAATLTRQASGLTLFADLDPSTGGIVASGHGPYRGVPGGNVSLVGVAAAGVAPYGYQWSVLTRPAASARDVPAFEAQTAMATFTPDVPGEYLLRFEATDSAGGRAVDIVSLTVLAPGNSSDITSPTAVGSLTARDTEVGGEVALAWDAATDDIGVVDHIIRRAMGVTGPYRTVGIARGLSFTDRSLTDGTNYSYAVAARDAAGNIGPFSDVASATPSGPGADVGDMTPPTSPALLTLADMGPSFVLLTWDAAHDAESDISHYQVFRNGVNVRETPLRSFRDESLAPATTYAYEVRAVNGAGLVGPAVTLSVTTLTRPPDCGQLSAPFTLVVDREADAKRADGRADILRVGVLETSTRIWFHIGVDNLTAHAPDTMFRVSWQSGIGRGFAAYVRATDGGALPGGLFVTVPGNEVTLLNRQPSVGYQCQSVVIGIQKSDILDPQPGDTLRQVRVTSSFDTTAAPADQIYDGAPDIGGVDYVMGSTA